MIRLLIIVPYPDLNEKVSHVLESRKYQELFNASVQLISIDKISQLDPTGYDIVIARGYTARSLMNVPNIPVLPLPISSYDIIRAISECKRKFDPTPKRICCIGPSEDFQTLTSIADLIDIPMEVIVCDSPDAVDDSIEQALKLGCDAFVGGYTLSLAARAKGLNAVSIETGEESISLVLDEAIRIVRMADTRKRSNRSSLSPKYQLTDIFYENPTMHTTIQKALSYAESSANILILGEVGAGKEMLAQGIHNHSRRSKGPFIVINCGAYPEKMLEYELFGYSDDYPTGNSEKIGLLELAHGGTLYLDEIGEIPPQIQTRLYYVLQTKQLLRGKTGHLVDIDVRVISSTSRNVKQMIESGKIRHDLFYHLDVLRLRIPPLRERGRDTLHLFQRMLASQYHDKEEASYLLTPKAQELLLSYPFYGNVHELRCLVERISILHTLDSPITEMELFDYLYPEDMAAPEEPDPFPPSVSEEYLSEYQHIQQVLNKYNGNQSKAAKELGIDRSTLWRKLKKYQN